MPPRCEFCGANIRYRGWLHIQTCSEKRRQQEKEEGSFQKILDQEREAQEEKRRAYRRAEGFDS